jgi:hypothetical protein
LAGAPGWPIIPRMQLDTDIWVYALLRRASQGGAFATVERRGDSRGGAVLVKILNQRTGDAKLLAEAAGLDGERLWMRPILSSREADIDAYIARAVRIDPDLWVVEVADSAGRHFLVEPVQDA